MTKHLQNISQDTNSVREYNKFLWKKKLFGIAFIVFVLGFTSKAWSQNDGGIEKIQYNVFANTTYFPTASPLTQNTSAFLTYSPESAEIAGTRKIKNIVTLSLFEEIPQFVPADFSASVTVLIEYGASSSSTNSTTQTLTVNYSKASGAKYNAKNYFSFDDAQYVKVTIQSITANPIGSFDPKNMLVLQNEMRVTRYYQLGSNVLPQALSSTAPATGADELQVNWQWPQNTGNTHTQLEWTWVEDELLSSYEVNGSVDYDLMFRNNATRIDLPLSFDTYKIPLLYGGPGKLYYRIRAINVKNESRTEGPWSNVQSQSFGGHNQSLNWQSTATYAEDGKRKVVIQYFDGSLRSRQTVTKDNVTNTTVSAETFYDGQGRPAIQILPAPGINNVIGYTRNLNLFNGQLPDEDPSKYFDLQPVGSTSSETPSLNSAYGTAKYYSSTNTEKDDGVNKNIPDGEGYPYTVTRYTPDATGRIMSQSGVGPALKMGSGHETKYYYGTPSQEELDGLFGTEVGNYTHYFKNMVKDANGQMSVSYVDMHGRTIATALAGDAPMNMVSLDISNPSNYPNQAGTQITRNLLNTNTNVTKGNSLESVNTLLVPATTSYQFDYKLTPTTLSLTANNAPVCYDCMYNLEISITDESGEQAPIVKKYSNINVSADDNCSTAIEGLKDEAGSPVANNEINFSQTLLPGSYIVRKTLTISESSLEKYKQEYIDKALVQTETDLINTIYSQMLLTSNCSNPPADACAACTAALGDFETFKNNYLLTAPGTPISDIQQMYDDEKLNCDRLCNSTSQVISSKRELMIADMLAYSGQYSRERKASDGSMYDLYNIDPATNPAGDDPKLAETLLPQHPEYQRLQYAESAAMKPVYDWITTFINTTTYADAVSKGYITNTTSSDPFYTTVGSSYKNAMDGKITNYFQGISMWQFAYGNALCKQIVDPIARKTCFEDPSHNSPPFTNLSATDQDKVWNEFKKLYMAEREGNVNNHIAVAVPLSNSQLLVDQGYLLHFPDNNNQLVTQNNNNSESGSDWSWYPTTPGGAPNLTTMPGSTPTDIYTTRCDSYIDQWKQTLLECPALANNVDKDAIISEITTAMKQICIASSNEANPYGASNVPSGTTGVPYQSFEEAINAIFTAHNIDRTNLCNPFVIEWPKPYSKGPNQTEQFIGVVQKCNCDQLSQLKIVATNAGADPNNFTSFSQFLTNTYGQTITQALYDAMMQNCSKLGTTSCEEIGHDTISCVTRECEIVGDAFVLPDVQPMPDFLKCGFTGNTNCVTCSQLSSYISDLKTYFSTQGNTYVPEPKLTGSDLSAKNIQDNTLFAQFVNYKTGFQYLWTDYAKKASDAGCNLDAYASNSGASQTVVCVDPKPLNDTTGFLVTDDPCQHVKDMAIFKAQEILKQIKQSLIADFEKSYRAKCLQNVDMEAFTVTYTPKEYHYTLYYYDMAGNLVKTVPPKGVRPDFSKTYTDQVEADKMAGVSNPRPHVFVTNYRYNSLNQVIAQNSPDANTSNFWYDRLGRLVVSQNAQQAVDGKYSYTLYDEFGRIKEVGQKPQTTLMTQTISQDDATLDAWINTNGGTKEQITFTGYDIAYGTDDNNPKGILYGVELNQENLRNRVSYTATKNLATDAMHYTATFYTYDVHGNVDLLLQDYKGVAEMDGTNNRFKRISYDYDLVSGKVNAVNYQAPFFNTVSNTWTYYNDAFYHSYYYDAENRLTSVETSRDKIVWERDAAYNYYKHGPLARTELGQLRVQGIDYVYTLQGWLKGVNPGSSVASNNESCPSGSAVDDLSVSMRDASIQTYTARQSITFEQEFESGASDAFETNIDPNLTVCNTSNGGNVPLTTTWDELYPATRDAYNFSLHYFNNDYTPVDGSSAPNFIPVLSAPGTNAQPLFNGNIAAMSVSIAKLGSPMVYNYRYDQLNRLVSMDAYSGLTTTGFTPVHMNDYKEAISYDPNGNILSYNRNGTTSGGKLLSMDALTYNYNTNTNQLNHVQDAVAATNYTEDIDNQNTDNYTYDAIGNLKSDASEGLSSVNWTVYGKIASIVKNGNSISYTYDASGNRITKTVSGKTTIYVRDATGNVMSVYEKTATTSLVQKELHLYGSSRLGILHELTTAPVDVNITGGTAKLNVFTRGEKTFELSNHLGNVLVTVSDKKIGHDEGNGTIDYFLADVISADDYFSGGMQMPSRVYNSGNYRYGFNGKEMDNEVKGIGNDIDYGAREYDPRIVRFSSVDPLEKKYPFYSSYQYAGNSPIKNIDIDGKEPGGNEWDWEVINIDHVRPVTLKNRETGETMLGTETQMQVKAGLSKTVFRISKIEYFDKGSWGNWEKETQFAWYNDSKDVAMPAYDTRRWHEFKTSVGQRAQGMRDLARSTETIIFGAAVAGAAAPLAVAATPTVTSFAVNYGTQALTASAGSRLFAAGANTTFQYIQNAPEFGWGFSNFKHMNATSIGLSAVNPFSVGVTAVGGNFGKISIADGTSQVIGGSTFNFKAAALGSTIEYFGGKLGDHLGGYGGRYLGMTPAQSNVVGNTLSGAVTTPATIIGEQATKQKNP